jgi:hypothetical protein
MLAPRTVGHYRFTWNTGVLFFPDRKAQAHNRQEPAKATFPEEDKRRLRPPRDSRRKAAQKKIYGRVGRGCGVGRDLGVTLGVVVGVGVAVGVPVGMGLGVVVAVGVGVGVAPDDAQYLSPVLK